MGVPPHFCKSMGTTIGKFPKTKKKSFLVPKLCSYELILHPHMDEEKIKPHCFKKKINLTRKKLEN